MQSSPKCYVDDVSGDLEIIDTDVLLYLQHYYPVQNFSKVVRINTYSLKCLTTCNVINFSAMHTGKGSFQFCGFIGVVLCCSGCVIFFPKS